MASLMTLKNKFLATTISLIILGMAISAVISYVNSKNTLESVINKQKEQIVELTLKQISSWIEARKLEVSYWGKLDMINVAVDGLYIKTANQDLAALKKDYKFYEALNVADSTGNVIASSDPETSTGLNISEKIYFKEALKGNISISDVFLSSASKKPVFVIAAPVKQEDRLTGAVCCTVSLEYFTNHFIAPVKIGKTGYIYIINKTGEIISHPKKEMILKINVNDFDFGKTILKNKKGTISHVTNNIEKITTFEKHSELGWIIATTTDISEILAPGKRLGLINIIFACFVVLLASVIIFFIAQTIVKPIYAAINDLTESSDQMTTCSAQVSTSSQALAQSTNEQATSILDASTALEKLSKMSKQNAESADSARKLINETSTTANTGADSMNKLISSMNDINESSGKITKVAKAIEEIAFQTNLLALNAAVEAARAGEAGKGFAVVAEEVRNLAQNAATQAQTTGQLISESTSRITDGTKQAEDANKSLVNILESIKKVTSINEEIYSASNEQAKGVEAINTSVTDIERVVQHNSANSEESASASEEMTAQSVDLKQIVKDLIAIVEGKNKAVKTIRSTTESRKAQATAAHNQGPAITGIKETSDDDFQDF